MGETIFVLMMAGAFPGYIAPQIDHLLAFKTVSECQGEMNARALRFQQENSDFKIVSVRDDEVRFVTYDESTGITYSCEKVEI